MHTSEVPPQPARPVSREQIGAVIQLDVSVKSALEKKVDDYLTALKASRIADSTFQDNIQALHQLGLDEIRRAAAMTHRLLAQQDPANMHAHTLAAAESLNQLKNQLKTLDPTVQQDLLKPRYLLGLLPLGNRLRGYFNAYKQAQVPIRSQMHNLYKLQDQLRKSNAAIDEEKGEAWDIMTGLEQRLHSAKNLDEKISELQERLNMSDPEKARILSEEVLYHLRHKQQDLAMQQAVCYQSYLAMDIIRKNNQEMIQGIDRVSTITVAALNTAVLVAQALTGQQLVMEQIKLLRGAAVDYMASAAGSLKQQSVKILDAELANQELGKLKRAFKDIFFAMDQIQMIQAGAQQNVEKTVMALAQEFDKMKSHRS